MMSQILNYRLTGHARSEMARRQINEEEVPISESDEDKPGIILDYDVSGNLVSLEILDASRRVMVPTKIEYQVAPLPA